jgi:anti-sigma regulatory factor (Ser/Thr protein kinase)
MPDTFTQTIQVSNDLAEVSRLNEVLSNLWMERNLPPDLEMPAVLALEEVLTNVIRHGCTGLANADIRVQFTFEPGAFEFVASDNGAPYDPLSHPDPDVNLPIEQRTPGGLGIFLVRRLGDAVSYEYRDGRNHLLFRKSLASADTAS